MRSVRWLPGFISCLAIGTCALAGTARGEIVLHDEHTSSPIVLDRAEDYLLRKVYVTGVRDAAALTLAGKIDSVRLENCRFGDAWAGINSHAAAVEAMGARISSFIATDTTFYDAEHQLVSLRDGSFGTVTFLHCTFKTSDGALAKIYSNSPWRTALPTTEFYNIDRLELLDNEYVNTSIVIHPSVKMVVFRGDISKLRVQSPETQVLRLEPGQDPSLVLPPGEEALALLDPGSDLPDAAPQSAAEPLTGTAPAANVGSQLTPLAGRTPSVPATASTPIRTNHAQAPAVP